MIRELLDIGKKKELNKYQKLVDLLSVATAIYIIFASQLYPEPILHRSISFSLFFAIIFLSYNTPGSKRKKEIPFHDIIFAVGSLSVGLYIFINIDRLLGRQIFFDPVSILDKIFFIVTILLIIEGSRRTIGPWLPILSLIALMYLFFGKNIPGRFGHQGFSLNYIVDGIFLTSYGIWGRILGTASGHVMIFMIFGTFFLKSGAGDFLFDFASSIMGSSKGGIAKVAVISSAMFGMVSGGPVTNVSTTGSLTIPAMIKRGYSKEFSAATESCASIGGTFMPPVMGSVAFIMSEVVAIPYAEIAKRAFIPAIIYFVTIFFVIDARSRKLGFEGIGIHEKKKFSSIIFKGTNFFVPMTYLVFRIMSGISPSRAGLETTLLIILLSIFVGESLFDFEKISDALITAVKRGVMIISTMTCCGILVGVIYITGITTKFSSYLMSMMNLSSFLTLVLVMLITVFLGLAMNTASAYLITAVICAPILVMTGYEPLSVHMFILYYAATASITPPVAMTSFIAATIAGTSPFKVSLLSMRMGITAYFLPFVFIYFPSILLYGTILNTLTVVVLSLTIGAIISYIFEGYLLGKNNALINMNKKRGH